MNQIYLPISLENNWCAYWYDSNTIRVYKGTPQANRTLDYIDYFINSHYLERTGSYSFGSYYSSIDCISKDRFTTNYWHRNDIDSICITFGVLFFVSISVILFICKSFFRGLFR